MTLVIAYSLHRSDCNKSDFWISEKNGLNHFMNVAELLLRKHQDAVFRIALQELKTAGINTYTFGGLDFLSNKFATILKGCGIGPGDVIGILLPQSAALAVAHLACLKVGAVILPIKFKAPLSQIKKIFQGNLPKGLIINDSRLNRYLTIRKTLPAIKDVFIACDIVSKKDFGRGLKSFWYEINFAGGQFIQKNLPASTKAYCFPEPIKKGTYEYQVLTHGQIIESLLNLKKPLPKEKIYWTVSDWSQRQFIVEELFKLWFSGCAIASFEAGASNLSKAKVLFNQLGYINLQSTKPSK